MICSLIKPKRHGMVAAVILMRQIDVIKDGDPNAIADPWWVPPSICI